MVKLLLQRYAFVQQKPETGDCIEDRYVFFRNDKDISLRRIKNINESIVKITLNKTPHYTICYKLKNDRNEEVFYIGALDIKYKIIESIVFEIGKEGM